MMIPIWFAELHSPLFIGTRTTGKNMGLKLFNEKGVTLVYDTVEKELLVSYQNVTSHLPTTSVHCYQPMTAETANKTEIKEVPVIPHKKIKAQVSGPTDHVFAGEGSGVVRDKR